MLKLCSLWKAVGELEAFCHEMIPDETLKVYDKDAYGNVLPCRLDTPGSSIVSPLH